MVFAKPAIRLDLDLSFDRFIRDGVELENLKPRFVRDNFFRIIEPVAVEAHFEILSELATGRIDIGEVRSGGAGGSTGGQEKKEQEGGENPKSRTRLPAAARTHDLMPARLWRFPRP